MKFAINGTAKVTGRPDIAIIQVTVTTHADSQAEALISKSVVNLLKTTGIKEGDLQVVPPRVWPEYNWTDGRQEIKGYQASNVITAKVRNLDVVVDLVTSLNSLDAEKAQVTSYQFVIENKKKLENKARKLAYADALKKAKLYAKQARANKLSLKSLSESFSSGGGRHPSNKFALAAARAMEAPAAPEPEVMEIADVVVELNVEAVFKAK